MTDVTSNIRDYGLEWYNRYYGLYRGIVTNTGDPEKLGRLKLRVPGIWDEEHDYWAWPVGMFAGKEQAGIVLPKAGDTVWVGFETGDSRYPFWMHGWWGQGEMPEDAENGYPNAYLLRLNSGYTLLFDPDGDTLRLMHQNGLKLEITGDGISLDRGSKKIFLGKTGQADEPAVLGDKNATVLDEMAVQLQTLAQIVQTIVPLIPPTPATAPAIAAVTAQLASLVPQIPVTKAKIPSTKSQNVRVDG